MIVILIYLFILLALFFIIRSFFIEELSQVSILEPQRTLHGKLLKVLAPLTAVNGVLFKPFPRIRHKLSLNLSFVKWDLTPPEFLFIKELLIALGVAGVILYLPHNYIFIIAAAAIGFLLPDVVLNSKVASRKSEIVRVLPETVDLLCLCVSAGLDFLSATKWIIAKARGNPMVDELRKVLEEIKVGRPKVEALRHMAKRLDIPQVSTFTRSLIQAEKMGTSIEETFTIISDDVRSQRSYQGKREAMKASLKMLIPLILFILPIILIIVAGPVLLEFMRGGFGKIAR